MANSSNKIVVPAARDAMDRFKMEAASDVGVTLKQGYNGDISARQAGSIGGQMVKNVMTTRNARAIHRNSKNRIVNSHRVTVRYIGGVVI
jgi:Small, acid-soluble spore proteins, alpha/beta type.